MFATCATPSPVRKWYTRDDDDDHVEEDGYQGFVQRGVDGMDGGSSGDIGQKIIRVGSHMLATKARCNAISSRSTWSRAGVSTSVAGTVAASGGMARHLRGFQGSR